jgi:hypothetical protein
VDRSPLVIMKYMQFKIYCMNNSCVLLELVHSFLCSWYWNCFRIHSVMTDLLPYWNPPLFLFRWSIRSSDDYFLSLSFPFCAAPFYFEAHSITLMLRTVIRLLSWLMPIFWGRVQWLKSAEKSYHAYEIIENLLSRTISQQASPHQAP